MTNRFFLSFFIFLVFALSCKSDKMASSTIVDLNPAAPDFNASASDQKAIDIADEVMQAMGGRAAYDNARYLEWNFFGSRKHWWDKQTGNIRIESQKDDFSLVMNIHNMKGKIKKDGDLISHPDSLSKYLQKGKEMWINDSYWLVMPYKLKDSGVTLAYVGEEKTDSTNYEIVGITFDGVGVTPENKYHLFVDQNSNLIKQWSFYRNAKDTVPSFLTPWTEYKDYNGIKLSGNRGEYSLTDIAAPQEMDSKIFTEL